LEIEEWGFKPFRGQYYFTDLPKGDPKYFQGLKTLTFVPLCFILWNEEDLKGQNGKIFVEGYEEVFFLFFFAKLVVEDTIETIPNIIMTKPTPGGEPMCKWHYWK
jgi:hypothetical protein